MFDTLTFDSKIVDNKAEEGAGILSVENTGITASKIKFSGNEAIFGGGILSGQLQVLDAPGGYQFIRNSTGIPFATQISPDARAWNPIQGS